MISTKILNRSCPQSSWFAGAGMILLIASASLPAALPPPLVRLRSEEGTGIVTTNTGSLGGSASLIVFNDYPMFTNVVASGPFAPSPNSAAVDFGNLGALQGGQQVNLLTDTNLVGDGALGTNLIGGFTACGWLNARTLSEGWGGNRIAYALTDNNGQGFDVVQLGDGSLRVGVNSWPDGGGGGPISSVGKITADPAAGSANWVFFAVTFDPALANGNLKYYFGRTTNLASLDTQFNYTGAAGYGGVISNAGPLTLGNSGPNSFFSTGVGAGSQSRVFQGLIDEFQVFGRALTAAEVQEAQLNGAVPPVAAAIAAQPVNLTVFEGQSATFSVQASGSAPITYQWQTNGINVVGGTNASLIFPNASTNLSGTIVKVWVGNPITPDFASSNVTLTVLPENNHKIFTSLSANPANNSGNLHGSGTFTIRDGYPAVTTNVPSGAFTPANNVGSVDFGGFTDYTTQQGGRAVNFANLTGNGATMGPMPAFTICGWLNCADLTSGYGGNRIIYCLDQQNKGFDLVQNAAGSLVLGVNQWPDNSPAISLPNITADSANGVGNWVFFAVTYDGSLTTTNVIFYWGSGSQAATAEGFQPDYNMGPITQSGILAIGNANSTTWFAGGQGSSGDVRSFRGLIDEVHVYNKVLNLAEIQAIQVTAAIVPSPTLSSQLQGNQIALGWVSPVSFQLQSRTNLKVGNWVNVGVTPTVNGNTNTVLLPATNPAQFFRLQGQ